MSNFYVFDLYLLLSGIDLLYGGVNEDPGDDRELEESSAVDADTEDPNSDHEKFKDESPVGSKSDDGDEQVEGEFVLISYFPISY